MQDRQAGFEYVGGIFAKCRIHTWNNALDTDCESS